MTYILDTHIIFWFANGDDLVSDNIKNIITNEENLILVSAVSLHEIAIKQNIGRLIFDFSFLQLKEFFINNNIQILHPTFGDFEIYKDLPCKVTIPLLRKTLFLKKIKTVF